MQKRVAFLFADAFTVVLKNSSTFEGSTFLIKNVMVNDWQLIKKQWKYDNKKVLQ